jgi:hypothetical protein
VPAYIDPSWEYFTPDPEVAEVLRTERVDFADLMDSRLYKTRNQGLRFGRGNPDAFIGRIAPKRYEVERADLRHRPCKTCGEFFLPERTSRRYCSRDCSPSPGAPRLHLDRPCQVCNALFRPESAGTKYCSVRCTGVAQRGPNYKPRRASASPVCRPKRADRPCSTCGVQFHPTCDTARFCSRKCSDLARRRPEPSDGCKFCGAPIPPSRSRNQSVARVFCSKSCKNRAHSRNACLSRETCS